MTCTENAKVINMDELKEIIDEELTNPTVERLMFLETKRDGSKIFPCYVEAYGYDDIKPSDNYKSIAFYVVLAQYMKGEFCMVKAKIRGSDLGVNKRIWDKPPKKSLREETPWVEQEAGVQ